ncbi:MAG TPA: hypothetical protein VMH90_07205 [Thermoplasmata archaeon]|nr:hypothetical protein [Thermoplasmata archaeon]
MGADAGAPEALLRERAYLALLLLVGAGAVVVGLYQTLRSGAASLSAIFDLALGACVLLVTWLFLAPSAWPTLFGDPAPRERPVRRRYLGAAPEPLLTSPRTPAPVRSATAPSAIPRWADPMVHPKVEAPIRPVAAAAAMPSRGAAAAIPRPRRPSPAPAPAAEPWDVPEELPRAVPTDPDELRVPRWDPELSAGRGTHSLEVLEELDRIEAELRNFVPIEPPPTPTAPIGLEDLVD